MRTILVLYMQIGFFLHNMWFLSLKIPRMELNGVIFVEYEINKNKSRVNNSSNYFFFFLRLIDWINFLKFLNRFNYISLFFLSFLDEKRLKIAIQRVWLRLNSFKNIDRGIINLKNWIKASIWFEVLMCILYVY